MTGPGRDGGSPPEVTPGPLLEPLVCAETAGLSQPADDAGAHLGLNLWKARAGRGALHHIDLARYRITGGVPRAAAHDLATLHAEFADACARAGLRTLHFGLTDAALEFLPALPGGALRGRWHVGDLPVFDLVRWRDEAGVPAGIRAQVRRAQRAGVRVMHWRMPPADPAALTGLLRARDAWLRAKPLPPLRFMTTPYLFAPWPQEGVFVAEHAGKIVGFLVASRALFGPLLRVDAVARVPDAPNGTAESLVSAAFRHAATRGIPRATLGLAPFAGRSGRRSRFWTDYVATMVRRLGAPLYSFSGLEAFKAKFAPDAWVPLYCVAPDSRFRARDLLALARAFAGGSLRTYAYRSLVWRFSQRRDVRAEAGAAERPAPLMPEA